MKKISEHLVSVALFLFGMLPAFAFFVWIERNMALPGVGTWIGWPWIFLDGSLPIAIGFDLALIAGFGFFHSALAGRAPRAFYMIVAGLSAVVVMSAWQPTGVILYQAIPAALPALVVSMVIYWGLILASFASMAKVEPLHRFVGLSAPAATKSGTLWTGGLYARVRHPLYTLTFAAWIFTPLMSLDRAVFIVGMALYLAVAIRREERRLVDHYGETYRRYQATTPMLIPRFGR